MKAAQDRQKSYADNKRRPLEFEIGDKVFLKVAPMKQVLRFGLKGKLAPRYIGPFEVTKRIGPVAYRLALPPHLAKIHDVFHVSLLRKAEVDPSRVLPQIPLEIDENLTLEMKPVKVLDYSVKELRNKKIPIIKILWRNSQIEERRPQDLISNKGPLHAHIHQALKNYFLVTGNNALVNGQALKNYFLVTGNNTLVNG
ncbi:uncharacterized protein [Populus alba]|uniref:uncharacterized protein n=1 Tax=Populus alba TaxID=43335 RepID=UPI00158CBF06|nr:uncharacterized protein LOC118060406 [Populus alba]